MGWPRQMAALREVALPTTRKGLQQFFRLANYYRRFVLHFSTKAGALTNLLKGKGKHQSPLPWSPQTKAAFHDIWTALCTNATLYVPLPNQPFCLYTDSSASALGAVLTQGGSMGEKPITFLSRKLTTAEQKYAVTE